MRVGIIALLHESNTFISAPTRLEHFHQNCLVTGEEVRARMAGTPHEVGGFFSGLEKADIEAVPIFCGRAYPFGTITADTFAALLDMMFDALAKAGPLDGVLIAPHGATVSQSYPDGDGHWMAELRKRVGPKVPIIGTLDPHGNLSPKMVAACNALVAYRSNPHLDQKARGEEAARLMAGTLRGEIHPTMAASFPPLAINIERQCSTEPHCRGLYALADEMLARPGVLSNSIMLGFPYADVEEMGSSFIVVTENDQRLAQRLADELAAYLWAHREEFDGKMIGIDEALDQAQRLDGPICLLDMGDNVGGGSPADSTFLAHALHERRMARSFVCLCDPEAVQQAAAAGAGKKVTLRMGGKSDQFHGSPLETTVTVLRIHDGKFEELETRHGGFTKCDQGATAIVRTESGLTVMLTSLRMPPFSLRQLTTFGVDPAEYHVLVAKGVNAPVAAYAPVCRQLIRVNTPGSTTADMNLLTYHHRRRPMFPFERDMKL